MAGPAAGAISILQTAGILHTTPASTTALIWLARIGKLLETPDKLVVAYDTGGLTPNAAWLLDQPTIQIFIRGGVDGYQEAWDKAKQVKDVLLGLTPQDVNGDRWSGVTMLSDIAFLQYDSNDRPMFSTNYRVFLEPATNVLTNRKPLDYVGP